MTLRPGDPAFVADPYPAYARLREQGPTRDPDSGLWLLARHRDVHGALRDRRFARVFSPKRPQERFATWNALNERAMLELEPPEHTRQRRLVAAAFTPRRVAELRPRVEALTADLLDRAVDDDRLELVSGLAEPLPVAVIAELLGVPEPDRPLLRPWSNAIVGLYELSYDDAAATRATTAAAEFDAYLRHLLAVRRARPENDLISALAQTDGLADDEIVAVAVLLLNAGHEATVNALANAVLALLRAPDQLARLRADPLLLPTAVDELLRFDSPLSLFQRTATEDVEIGGAVVRRGERVGLLLGGANRDEEVFPGPDTVDVGRRTNPHLALGAGVHFCLGAPLARLELSVALSTLLRRYAVIELAGEPVVRPSFQFRGLDLLPLRVVP